LDQAEYILSKCYIAEEDDNAAYHDWNMLYAWNNGAMGPGVCPPDYGEPEPIHPPGGDGDGGDGSIEGDGDGGDGEGDGGDGSTGDGEGDGGDGTTEGGDGTEPGTPVPPLYPNTGVSSSVPGGKPSLGEDGAGIGGIIGGLIGGVIFAAIVAFILGVLLYALIKAAGGAGAAGVFAPDASALASGMTNPAYAGGSVGVNQLYV